MAATRSTTATHTQIAAIGECMLELSPAPATAVVSKGLPMSLSYGGDTLNCALYMARQGINVDFVTAVGDDTHSKWMVQQWQQQHVGCDLVHCVAGRESGLYMAEVDAKGERSFTYWRDRAPARELFDDAQNAAVLCASLRKYPWLFISGITLGIYSDEGLARLFHFLASYRKQGGKVAFDSNYRPKLWLSINATKLAYEKMYQVTDLALPTIEDEMTLFGDIDQQAVIERIQSAGVNEIVLKMGEQGCKVVTQDLIQQVACNRVDVVDTTSAGDSFNAGYLAARLNGSNAIDAARNGHALAAAVIQHRGAIIPLEAMPAGLIKC